MADYIVDGAHLESIANAIREKTNTTDGIRLADMGAKIKSINIPNPTPTPEISAGTGGIIDVVKLPTEDISESSFYRLMTAIIVYNQYDCTESNYICYCVDGLPETGLPATNASMDIMNVYYNVQDGIAYGYVDEMLSAGLNVPSGWYDGETLMAVAGQSYGGAITDIGDDPCDDVFRVLLKYDFYIHKNGWMKLPFAYEKAPEFDIQWDGVIGDKFSMDLSAFGAPNYYYVKVSDDAFTEEQFKNATCVHSSGYSVQDEFPSIDNTTYVGMFTVCSDSLVAVIYDAATLNAALGLPAGYLTNGTYFSYYNDGETIEYTTRLVAPSKIVKIDSKYLNVDVDLTVVEDMINTAIGNAIGGSY